MTPKNLDRYEIAVMPPIHKILRHLLFRRGRFVLFNMLQFKEKATQAYAHMTGGWDTN